MSPENNSDGPRDLTVGELLREVRNEQLTEARHHRHEGVANTLLGLGEVAVGATAETRSEIYQTFIAGGAIHGFNLENSLFLGVGFMLFAYGMGRMSKGQASFRKAKRARRIAQETEIIESEA